LPVAGVILGLRHARRGDIQRHKTIAPKVVARQRLLRDHLPNQIRGAAKRAIKAGPQPGTPDGLRRLARGLPDVLTNQPTPTRAPSTGSLSALGSLPWRCFAIAHHGY